MKTSVAVNVENTLDGGKREQIAVYWARLVTMEVMRNGQILEILKAKQDLQMNWRRSLRGPEGLQTQQL